jgi:hypothetical protein
MHTHAEVALRAPTEPPPTPEELEDREQRFVAALREQLGLSPDDKDTP